MIYLDVQDVPEAIHRGYGEITLVDYSGDLYPELPRQEFLPRNLLWCRRIEPVQLGFHFDLSAHSALLETLLWAGWRQPFTVQGRYRPRLFPLSVETYRTFRLAPRSICTVGVDVPAGHDSVWQFNLEDWVRPLFSRTRWYPWAESEPPLWAQHSWRNYLTRKWRLSQLHAIGEEQVRLRQVWHDLSTRKTPA